MSQEQGWIQRQRAGLWHFRKGGLKGYQKWQNRQKEVGKSPSVSPRRPVSVIVDDLERPVIAGMATIPSRIPLMKEAFHSIYWQVDEVHIFLNGFEKVPEFLAKPNVKIYRSQDFDDYKDVGKFFALTQIEQGILFTVDDDILYPVDYVSKMLSYLASTRYESVVGVHGFHLPARPKSFFDRHMFHFRRELVSPAFASVLGTGTTAFDIARLGIKFEDFTSYGMADIHFAAYLKRQGIPALVIPRAKEWLMPLSIEEDLDAPSLYEQTQRNSAPHGKILRSAGPWGETYVIAAWRELKDRHILDEPLTLALEAISATNTGDNREIIKQVSLLEPNDSRAVLEWLSIYGTYANKVRLFKDIIEASSSRSLIRDSLSFLWKTDTTEALTISLRLVEKYPKDIQLVRQNASFCSGYFMPEEADAGYLRAIRLAGASGNNSTPSILYDYFRFLIRYNRFERATAVAVTLRTSHSKVPYFQACMVLCAVHEESTTDAAEWLTRLLMSPKSTRRKAALVALLRALAETQGTTPNLDGSVLFEDVLQQSETDVEDLVSLLKIMMIVGDQKGADRVFDLLERDHSDFLLRHEEISRFYKSHRTIGSERTDKPYAGHRYVLSMSENSTLIEGGPLVSVILTAFNSAETIAFAIESILNQTHRNIELIVVDDKSEDHTVEIAEQYAQNDARVRVLRNETNVGPYGSRNKGIEHATGQYIAIQDADDVSVPERLEIQLASMTADVKAVLGQHIRIDSAGAIHLENDGSIVGHGPVTLLVRRGVFDEVGAFASVRTRGDKEFESRMEYYYGSHALLRTEGVLVYALHDKSSNSWIQTSSLLKKRNLMLFKESYTRRHTSGDISPKAII